MRRILSAVLLFCLLASMSTAAAIAPGDARTVIGADLTEEEVGTVYSQFGIARGDVTELTVTNAEERKYLEGLVADDRIGTRSISCVYIEIQEAGAGLSVETSNIDWCTESTYLNALVTAGIDDARVVVAAPFSVSGTAALTGIYKAYEDITGQALREDAKQVSTQELVVTAALSDQIGSYDAASIVNELKLILQETEDMSDEALQARIREIAAQYDVSLTDEQIDQLVGLCRALEKLDVDTLTQKVQAVQDTIQKLSEVGEKISDTAGGIAAFFAGLKRIFAAIGTFFANLFG